MKLSLTANIYFFCIKLKIPCKFQVLRQQAYLVRFIVRQSIIPPREVFPDPPVSSLANIPCFTVAGSFKTSNFWYKKNI